MRRHRPRPDRPQRHDRRERQRQGSRRASNDERVLLYGLHAVEAALVNPRRQIGRLIATENAAHRLASLLAQRGVTPEEASPRDLDRLLGSDAVHQGVALETEQLPPLGLDEVKLSLIHI